MNNTLPIRYFYIVFFLLFSVSLNSQSKYGKITMDELKMDSYPQDSTASAVVLSKVGRTEFKTDRIMGFIYEYTLEMKVKILTQDGLDLCTREISYYDLDRKRRESIKGLSGTTYNLVDGKIEKTKLSKEFIVDEEHDDVLKVKKFTMPAAKIGSVIEYKYTIVSPFDYSLPTFEFQNEVPTQYVSYKIVIPEYYTYNVTMQGHEQIDFSEKEINLSFPIQFEDDDGRLVSLTDNCHGVEKNFSKTNIPAVKDEPYMWAKKDYITKVNFELRNFQFKYGKLTQYSSSWAKIDEQMLKQKSFGGNLNKESLFKKDLTPGDLTLASASFILDMIRKQVKWDKKSAITTSNIGDALKKGLGNSADMNFLLINALSAAGFDSYPVVLSTRSNGLIPMAHPTIASFNYMIAGVTINSKRYFVDVSDVYSIWNVLPEKVMVTQGRIVKKNASEWVDLSAVSSGTSYLASSFKFEDGQYVGTIKTTERGMSSHNFRQYYFNNHSDKENYIENFSKNLSVPVEDFEIENENKLGSDVKVSFTIKPDITLGDEFLYINPMFIKHRTDNPFKSETRKYPINFNYLGNYIQNVTIEIPKGYVVEELPKSEKVFFDEDGSIALTYNIVQQDDKIQLFYQYQLKTLFVGQDEYPVLRDFFSKVVLKNSEQIVLKKVE